MRSSLYQIQGKRFNRLFVELLIRKEVNHKRKRSRIYAVVVCDCGAYKTVQADDLIQGKTKSCGCLRIETSRKKKDTLENLFWSKVDKNGAASDYRPDLGSCWLWIASTNAHGYGTFKVENGSTLAHRISWSMHGGVVPKDMQIDHLCRVRNCVNPKHLEVVSPRVNTHRGFTNARKIHCPKGHLYDGDNLYTTPKGRSRQCRECVRQSQRRYQARKRVSLV